MIEMVSFPSPVSKLYFRWARGLEKHGDKLIQLTRDDEYKSVYADCYYQTNERKQKFFTGKRAETQGQYFDHIINSNKPFIVSESNPFRQYDGWLRFGWNSYKWTKGNFNNDNVDDTRWKRFQNITGVTFNDWHSPGDDIIIMGQKEGDSALNELYEQGFDSFYDWVNVVIKNIRTYTDRRIVIRPHPRNLDKTLVQVRSKILKNNKKNNVILSKNLTQGGNQGGAGLDADLNKAYCVVSFNSLSSIEAVCKGIPVFSLNDGSMTYPISHKSLSQIENINYEIDRTQWQNQIAYTMWNKVDVISGECWEHLKPVYFS